MRACPALRPRRDLRTQPDQCVGAAFRYFKNVGSRDRITRLNHTACSLPVYASQYRSPGTTQHSVPAAGQALPDGIGYPQGSNERFQVRSLPPFPGFAWRARVSRAGSAPNRVVHHFAVENGEGEKIGPKRSTSPPPPDSLFNAPPDQRARPRDHAPATPATGCGYSATPAALTTGACVNYSDHVSS